MNLKPPRIFFSPKSKELWMLSKPKYLQTWRWAAYLILSPCEHCRGLESWKESPAVAGLHCNNWGSTRRKGLLACLAAADPTAQPSCNEVWTLHLQKDTRTAFVMVLNHNTAFPFRPVQLQLPSSSAFVWGQHPPWLQLSPCCRSSMRTSIYALSI